MHAVRIDSLCILAFFVSTIAMYSKENANNTGNAGYNAEIEKDWDRQHTAFLEFKPKEEITSYYQRVWLHASILYGEPINKAHAVIHSLHEDTNPPYAVILTKLRAHGTTPFIIAIPRHMFKDDSWEKCKSFPRNDFATRWNYKIPGPPTIRLPIKRMLTSNDGRQIKGIVLAKSNTSIRYRRADNREVNISLTSLSENDQKWIMQTSNCVPRILCISSPDAVLRECVNLGYDVSIPPEKENESDLSCMTHEEIQNFDIIFKNNIYDIFPTEKQQFRGVIIRPGTPDERKQMLKIKDDREVKTERKTVIYHELPTPKIVREALETAVRLAGYEPL